MNFFSSLFPVIRHFRREAKIKTGNFCNRSGQLLPATDGEMDFLPAKVSIFGDGTSVAQQV